MTDSIESANPNSERELLLSVREQPFFKRIRIYMKFSGPGFLQSAMTLGGGTAGACLVAGSQFMYDLLWVQPLAMFLGTIILAAVARQTVNTGERPYQAFWDRLHPAFALVWGITSLLACIIWHIPQYSLATTSFSDMFHELGLGRISTWIFAVPVLIFSIILVWQYDRGKKGIRIYEIVIKILVWGIVFIFAVVTFASKPDWGGIWRGFTFHNFSKLFEPGGDQRLLVVIGMLGASVGINMVFLYPYSLLKKKWSQAHEGLAFFDLISGMTIPFILATTFIIIGTANTVGRLEPEYKITQQTYESLHEQRTPAATAEKLKPLNNLKFTGKEAFTGALRAVLRDDAAADITIPLILKQARIPIRSLMDITKVLSGSLGLRLSALILGIGLIAIAFSTITTHMLAAGFIACEMFKMPSDGWSYRLFALLPAIGIVGAGLKIPFWLAVFTSGIAVVFMPITLIGFLILQNSVKYLGSAMPVGGKRLAWNIGLGLAILITAAASIIRFALKMI
ncbi:divalent metal cation transporter [candidate division KSB1 bacterium]|nr:divalent metal cation transporter [candidate division KSB1 bacterium]